MITSVTKRTDRLVPGDRIVVEVHIVTPSIVRTVREVILSPYVNHRNEPIFYVIYEEGRTTEWGEGNSGLAGTSWALDRRADDEPYAPVSSAARQAWIDGVNDDECREIDDEQECSQCEDLVYGLSSDGLCDGCVEEADV